MAEPLPSFGQQVWEYRVRASLSPEASASVPVSRTTLIGREREVAALREMVLDNGAPLVTMTGVGGGGKTGLAQAVAPEFRLTPVNAEAVADVCTRLEGIPLALELAAARVRVLTVPQILSHLDDVFRLLSGGNRVAPTRQQTLRTTLDWSYELLTDQEQTFFQRLAIFVGGFDLEAAEGLAGSPSLSLRAGPFPARGGELDSTDAAEGSPPRVGEGSVRSEDVLDILSRLVDKSLVIVEDGGLAARYRLLEPLRQYAWQGRRDAL